MKPVCPKKYSYKQKKNKIFIEYRCHHQLVAQPFWIYYTQLVHVSAIYPGHLQGVKSLVDVYAAQVKVREFSLNDF